MSLPLIQINGECEVPIQIISLRLIQMLFFEFFKLLIFYKMFFLKTDRYKFKIKIEKKKVFYQDG